MLDLKNAEKTLTFLTGRIVGKDINISLIKKYGIDNLVTATSSDISHLLGINFLNSINISSAPIDYRMDKDSYFFRMTFRYHHLNNSRPDALHDAPCFETHLNNEGSISRLLLAQNQAKWLTPSDPQFKKLMTTKDMEIEFFNLLDSHDILESPEKLKALNSLITDQHFFVDTYNSKGDTCLHHAINRDLDIDILKTLLAFGANVNSQNVNGESPLYAALERKSIDSVEFLIDNGANLIVNGKQETAIAVIRNLREANPNNISNTDACGDCSPP